MLRAVLFANGVVDFATGLMLVVFPAFGLRIPGNQLFGPVAAFAAGGWGIATIALGVGRTWAAFVPRHHRMWNVLGMLEGTVLGLFSILCVVFTPTTLTEALIPICVGSVFSFLYIFAFVRSLDGRRSPPSQPV